MKYKYCVKDVNANVEASIFPFTSTIFSSSDYFGPNMEQES